MKYLSYGKNQTAGRNNRGKITVYHRGGGHKQSIRVIDFKRHWANAKATVISLHYDPARKTNIALVLFQGPHPIFKYILLPANLKPGHVVAAGPNVQLNNGNATPLRNLPQGTLVHNIALSPYTRGILARAPGCYATVIAHKDNYTHLRLSSGQERYIHSDSYATIGTVDSSTFNIPITSKAGRTRWLGIRPTVRGVAMNPIDHPHGGGEGKSSGGRPSSTPWGRPTKGPRTRNNKRTDTFMHK